MSYLDMSMPFYNSLQAAGLALPINCFTVWEDFDVLYCAGGEL